MEDFAAAKWARIVVHGPLGDAGLVVDMATRDLLPTLPRSEAFHANRTHVETDTGDERRHADDQIVSRQYPMPRILRQCEAVVQIKRHHVNGTV